jgi:LacI family transcriptional regulator, gluconate utilization system Gnt-I transcriptional repressor
LRYHFVVDTPKNPKTTADKLATTSRRRSSGRVTLTQVAQKAGVSAITASRAMRDDPAVSGELAARVKAAAEQLGYVPDVAARALASAKSSSVVVLVPMLTNAVFVDLIEAVHDVLIPAGYQALIGITHYDPQQEEQLIRSYLAHRPAGFLVTGFDRTEVARRLIAASNLPCIHLMEVASAPGVYSVGFSQADAGAAMTQHLIDRGHKRIAFAAAQLDPRTLQRAEGYRRAMRAAGLYDARLEVLSPERSSIALGGELLAQTLQRVPQADAIFFCNDDLAQGGVLAARRMSIDVPGRIAMAGFNDLTGSDQMLPPLTTIRTPRAAIGKHAAQMMLQLLREQPVAQPSLDLGFEVVVRESS